MRNFSHCWLSPTETVPPALLPPPPQYDAPLVLALSRADAALSKLSGIGRHLPIPHLLLAPYVRREAVLSSHIVRARLHRRGKALELVDHLFINPYITVANAARLLGTSKETARKAVVVLEESGIIHEVTGRKWARLYLAESILEAIQD